MSTQNEQDFKVELEPPRFENGKELFIAGLRERPAPMPPSPNSGSAPWHTESLMNADCGMRIAELIG